MTKNNLIKVIVIVGPTATNKTRVGIALANAINGELINADAFQCYKELNIGVNKPMKDEMKEAKFHLIGNVSIYDKYDIKKFQMNANELIRTIDNMQKIPIVVGGSHLYVDALINNYDLLESKERDDTFNDLTNEELFEQLDAVDHNLATKITLNNRKRLVRALQIIKSKKTMTARNKSMYDYLVVCCSDNREALYERINRRVDEMIKLGWVEEVRQLLHKDTNIAQLNALKAIGYISIINSIQNNEKLDISKIKQDTRHYAKRQLTWIRHHYTNMLVYNQSNLNDILMGVKQWLAK